MGLFCLDAAFSFSPRAHAIQLAAVYTLLDRIHNSDWGGMSARARAIQLAVVYTTLGRLYKILVGAGEGVSTIRGEL